VQHLDPRALGPQAAEHGVRHRQVDRQPLEPDQRRRADARVRRRRARAAGTCQIDNERAADVLAEIVGTIESAERQPARA
jgi:hypothetical protein